MSTWFEAWLGLSLRDSWWLLLLLMLPVALWGGAWRRARAVTFAPAELLHSNVQGEIAPLPRSWRMRLASLPKTLVMAGCVLAIVALARPVQRVPLPVSVEGIDVVMCLDVSSSMAAEDLGASRSRLEVAKAAAREFIAGRPHDHIGLVKFARFFDVVCPPTLDHDALVEFLDGVDLVEREGDEDRTGIGIAVARSVQVLDSSEASSKIVILVTDGEENVASAGAPDEIGPLQAGQLALQHGVRVYTIAVGEGVRGSGGQLQPLDTSQVRQLAESTGGSFHRAASATHVQQVYAEIAALERAEFSELQFRLEDRFLMFLLPGLLCLLLGWGLRATVLEVQP